MKRVPAKNFQDLILWQKEHREEVNEFNEVYIDCIITDSEFWILRSYNMNDLKIDSLSPASLQRGGRTNSNDPTGFGKVIKGAIDNVNGMEKDADMSILNLLQGKEEVHSTMIALQKADISMRMLLSVRNKVIEAYREIMRMQF